ncbi:MAG: hypothetical protein R2688_00325 [Fimbriimonadaceae bacterium]
MIALLFKNRGPLDGVTTAWMGIAVIVTFIEMMLVSVFTSIGKLWDAAGIVNCSRRDVLPLERFTKRWECPALSSESMTAELS